MTGQVLDYSVQNREGVISGDDGQRYRFGADEWPSGRFASQGIRGQRVDFEVDDDGRAVNLYLLDSPSLPKPVEATQTATAPTGTKVRMTAALFALLLGLFGVDQFYIGKTGAGIGRIVLTVTMLGAPASAAWSLMSAIKFFSMTDADFDATYN